MYKILNTTNQKLFNPANERLIKKYTEHVQQTKRADAKTILALHKSLRSFEVLTDFENLTKYNPEVAKKFLRSLRNLGLSASYMFRITSDAQKFFRWLADEPAGKHIHRNDADYLTLSQNEINEAHATGYKQHLEYKALLKIVHSMPSKTIVDRRNRALVALIILTSPRVSELCNFRLDSIMQDPKNGFYFIDIDPRKIKGIKFRTCRQATCLNIPDLLKYVLDWRHFLQTAEHFDKTDPLFPAIAPTFAQMRMFEHAVKRRPISPETAERIFNEACIKNDQEPLSIHSVRRTRARHIESITHDDIIVALQQDFGHSHIGTTRYNYGNISSSRQRELISSIVIEPQSED